MSVEFFKPKDFPRHNIGPRDDYAIELAQAANAKLQKLIESWPVVHARTAMNPRLCFWDKNPGSYDTHVARLAFIEEIPKEPCKHEPMRLVTENCAIPNSKKTEMAISYFCRCKHCGVELEAEWKAKS